MARNALGRGLGALIREPDSQAAEIARIPAVAHIETTPGSGGSTLIDIDLIEPSPYQPRTHFREEALAELAQSIRASGIIQPLVLRRVGSRFQLLAGERRWRAAQRAGLNRVPAVIREVSDEAALEITLVENIQREDLNPIEEARAFERLINEFHLTQEEVAAKTGKDRATIGNATRLLRLEKPILELIEDGSLSAGHGRALLSITDPQVRLALSQRAAHGRMTVRQLERSASRRVRLQASEVAEPQLDANTRAAIEQIEHMLGMRVRLRQPTKNRPGELAIEYHEESQLVWLYDRLVIEK
ncbi:MAG: chromosome partitioning protein ParB [Acidobacteria bacterium]|nr:MAG: chromosome partitioning protein ParB [Acidobacteriota bacterium]